MAKIGTLPLKGKSGETYSFNVWPMDQQFNAVGAVYAITKRHADSKGGHSHTVIYVGETSDLSTRFENHHKADCFNQHESNCICTHQDDDEESRLAKENDLLKQHNPPCND